MVVDVSDFGKYLEEPDHVRVTQLTEMRDQMLNQLTEQFSRALSNFVESCKNLYVIMWDEVSDFAENHSLQTYVGLVGDFRQLTDRLSSKCDPSWLH